MTATNMAKRWQDVQQDLQSPRLWFHHCPDVCPSQQWRKLFFHLTKGVPALLPHPVHCHLLQTQGISPSGTVEATETSDTCLLKERQKRRRTPAAASQRKNQDQERHVGQACKNERNYSPCPGDFSTFWLFFPFHSSKHVVGAEEGFIWLREAKAPSLPWKPTEELYTKDGPCASQVQFHLPPGFPKSTQDGLPTPWFPTQ